MPGKKTLLGIFMLLSTNLLSQDIMTADTNAFKSTGGTVGEVVRLISGAAGKRRNLPALRNLFLPTAHFTVLYHDDAFPIPAETVTLDEFLEFLKDPYYDDGFTELETGKVINEYNGIANVFQSYYVKDADGEEERGITSYQLVYIKDRWWIANIVWTGDSNGVEVPEQYLDR